MIRAFAKARLELARGRFARQWNQRGSDPDGPTHCTCFGENKM